MFCVQCEQTISTPAGKGCSFSQGMCGKTAHAVEGFGGEDHNAAATQKSGSLRHIHTGGHFCGVDRARRTLRARIVI